MELPPVYLDTPTITTGERLSGVKDLLELLQAALPAFEQKAQQELADNARRLQYEASEYFMERDILCAKYKESLPRFAAFAIVTLLHAVLETQLYECVLQTCRRTGATGPPRPKRRGLVPFYLTYLEKHGGVTPIGRSDRKELDHLGQLRNNIAHKLGRRTDEGDHYGWESLESIPLESCKDYIALVERVLERVVTDTRKVKPRSPKPQRVQAE